MGKHKKWTLADKVKIVKEFKAGATISYLNNKYGISGCGTVSRWNQEYDEGRTAEFLKFDIMVIRFSNDEILNDIDTVLNTIRQTCNSLIVK